MRWTEIPPGSKRIKKKFFLFPRVHSGVGAWLETGYVEEIYLTFGGWHECSFATKEEYEAQEKEKCRT